MNVRRFRWIGLWSTLVALALWAREPAVWWLTLAGLTLVVAAGRKETRAGLSGIATAVGVAAALAAAGAHVQLARISEDWDRYLEVREIEVVDEFEKRFSELQARGDSAVDELARVVGRAGVTVDPQVVSRLRRRTGFPAVAVYGPDGEAVVWDGIHRGRVPVDVRLGVAGRYAYQELPLFSHLYVTAPVPSIEGTAVVAELMRSELPAGLRAPPVDFESRFARDTGAEIHLSRPQGALGDSWYDLVWGEAILLSMSVATPAESELRSSVGAFWVRVVVALIGLAWLILALAGSGERYSVVASVASLGVLMVVLPWDALLAVPEIFDVARFLLPGAGALTMGRVLSIAVALTFALALLSPDRRRVIPWPLVAGLLLMGLLSVLAVISSGASMALLAGDETGWVAYQATLALPAALVVLGAFGVVRPPPVARRPVLLLLGALVTTVLAAAVATEWVRYQGGLPLIAATAWIVPTALAHRALPAWSGWRRGGLTWVVAACIGGTLALPFAWAQRTKARVSLAEVELERLGNQVDPYLPFLLDRLARTAEEVQPRASSSVDLLYESWIESDFADAGYQIWLSHWSSGNLLLGEFRVGVGNDPRPSVVADGLAAGRDSVSVYRPDQPFAHYLMYAPLSDGSVVSAVVPPRKSVTTDSRLGPLFARLAGVAVSPLTLIPLTELGGDQADTETRWQRVTRGWLAEKGVSYADGPYHAHYLVDLPTRPLLLARGALLLALDLTLLLAAWMSVWALLHGVGHWASGWKLPLFSFRGRVSLALFGFFLLSNAIFGTLAYRNISRASERAALLLAERVADTAAGIYLQVGRMDLLSGRVGGDLLEYRTGQLREGAVEALVDLGLYEGWLPIDVYRVLTSGEEILTSRRSRLGRWEYVSAFRRLPDGDILAVPVPLEAGAIAVGRRDVTHLLAFAVVAGLALSLVLALAVARTLTMPILTLQRASDGVGKGDLRVRLPADRADEFGDVFSAFNRMVRRLQNARRDLLRTTRRTQAIVDEAASGVIALDAHGRVSLVNPRAEALLGGDVPVGHPLAGDDGAVGELVRWTRLYLRDGLPEGGAEFQFSDRRIRVRARRITREEGPAGGAVLILEDVTDELRTERILAWGEMARQVAHEVKNPLTPIKLSIQHIERAWSDRRGDFEEILTKNADAMLKEIDRLASISSSFSRFGAPRAAGEVPLQPVRVGEVVGEVLALYRSGAGPVRFEQSIEDNLPPVRARVSEVKEVLVNLLENARAAITDTGTVQVAASFDGEEVVLSVRDDGGGIAPELLPRIFEPHFSTRSPGTGLGLAIVRRLVESWGASATAESRQGEGTVLRLLLRPWTPEENDQPRFDGDNDSVPDVRDGGGGASADPSS